MTEATLFFHPIDDAVPGYHSPFAGKSLISGPKTELVINWKINAKTRKVITNLVLEIFIIICFTCIKKHFEIQSKVICLIFHACKEKKVHPNFDTYRNGWLSERLWVMTPDGINFCWRLTYGNMICCEVSEDAGKNNFNLILFVKLFLGRAKPLLYRSGSVKGRCLLLQ